MNMTQKEVQRTYEEDYNSINSKDFIIGALVGGMIGAATALFVAPKAGRELRNDITEQARNISDKTEKLRRDITETAKEKTSYVSEVVSNKSAEIVNKVKSLKPSKEEEELEEEPIVTSEADVATTLEVEAQQKLDEAKKAFEETENELKQ
jgi:gas vesicle protein